MIREQPPPPAMPEVMQQFFELLTAHYRFQFLAAAVELELFTVLAKEPGLTLDEIGPRIDLAPRPLRVLLLGVANLGLVRKEGERYFNSVLAETLLLNDAVLPGRDFVRMERFRYRGMSWFVESLRADDNVGLREYPGEGDTLYERAANDPVLQPLFHSVMGAVTEQAASQLAQDFDFTRYRHVLDVGSGGAAVYPRILARRFPHLRITMLDLPPVAELARRRIEAEGLSDRVQAIGLDCLAEELPAGADLILFSHFLEAWSADRVQELLAKAYRAAPPGGGVLVLDLASNNERTGPWLTAHLTAYFLTIATAEAMVYTTGEFERWMEAAGFKVVAQRPVGMSYLLEGVKEKRR